MLGTLLLASACRAFVDLQVDQRVLARSLALDQRSTLDACLVDEGCLLAALPDESGADAVRRTLLRFSTRVWNRGTSALHIGRPPSPEGSGGRVPDGRTVEPWWEYASCHDHWHLAGYAQHTLLDADSRVAVDTVRGSKTGFCMRDNVCERRGARPVYTCDNQGLSAGCADHYGSRLPCQWLDVTDVDRTRPYVLRVEVNVDRRLVESNYTNNAAEVAIDWSTIRDFDDGRERAIVTGIVTASFLFAFGVISVSLFALRTFST